MPCGKRRRVVLRCLCWCPTLRPHVQLTLRCPFWKKRESYSRTFHVFRVETHQWGRFRHRWLDHINSNDIWLTLHEEVIFGHAAVNEKFCKGNATIGVHRFQDVSHLKTDGFKCCPDQVATLCVESYAANYTEIDKKKLINDRYFKILPLFQKWPLLFIKDSSTRFKCLFWWNAPWNASHLYINTIHVYAVHTEKNIHWLRTSHAKGLVFVTSSKTCNAHIYTKTSHEFL